MSRQQDNEELDPWTISYLPESSAICNPSPVNNDSGFELQGNFSPLEELTFSVNSSVSEPSGIGFPGKLFSPGGVSMYRHQFGTKAVRPFDDY